MSNRNNRTVMDADDDDDRGNKIEDEQNKADDPEPWVPPMPMWEEDDKRQSER
jgi:hypothetical protein